MFEQASGNLLRTAQKNTAAINEETGKTSTIDRNFSSAQQRAGKKIPFCNTDISPKTCAKSDEIKNFLREIFKPFTTLENKTEIEKLITDRTIILLNKKIGIKELSKILKNANDVDNKTAIFFGACSSTGFIAGAQASNFLATALNAYLTPAVLPFLPGLIIGMTDRFLNSVLRDVHVGYYTKGDPNMLDKIMQHNLERHQRKLNASIAHQTGALCAPYTIRNVARSVIAPIAAHFNQATFIDTLLDGLGGLGAGAYSEKLRNDGDRRELLMHPAYLLGQTNWIEQLKTLEHDPISQERFNRLKNQIFSKFPKSPEIFFNACKRLFTLSSGTEISLLIVCIAFNEWLKESTESMFKNTSPETSAFIKNTVGTFFLGTMYCILGASMTVAAKLSKMMERWSIQPAYTIDSSIQTQYSDVNSTFSLCDASLAQPY